MADLNKDIENDFNNRKPIDTKALKKEVKKIKKDIKKLKKSEARVDQMEVKFLERDLDEKKTSLAGRIRINVDGKIFKVKEEDRKSVV